MRGHISVGAMIIGMCAAMVAGPIVVDAQQAERGSRYRGRQMGQQRWWKNQSAAAKLALSGQQVERLDQIADAYQEKVGSVRPEYLQAYRQLVETLKDYDATQELIADQRAALEDVRSGLMAMSIDLLLEYRTVLSAEQFGMLQEVAPRALRLGQVSVRGSGTVSANN